MRLERIALGCSLALSLAPAARPDDAAISRRELDWRVDQAAYGAIVAGIPPFNRRDNDARKAIELRRALDQVLAGADPDG